MFKIASHIGGVGLGAEGSEPISTSFCKYLLTPKKNRARIGQLFPPESNNVKICPGVSGVEKAYYPQQMQHSRFPGRARCGGKGRLSEC